MENNDWRLQSLSITYNEWGEHKGLYTGAAKFVNGTKMDINFKLDQEKSNRFLALIQDEITNHAKELGAMLVVSLPIALPPAKTE